MSEEEKWIHQLSRKTWSHVPYKFEKRPLPPNTLTNADGTPYSAGHDRNEQQIQRCAMWLHKELLRNNYVNQHGEWSEEESAAFDEFLTVKIQNILVEMMSQ